MSFDLNDEILQDFLVEAGEILEQLSEQLVDLEQRPNDYDLLNAVFRGFHTIKGGAGFLSIEPLVEVCHRSEDVFNVLRQGQRKVSADLMDSILEVLDVANAMFGKVREGMMPDHAEPDLIQKLNHFTKPENTHQENGLELTKVKYSKSDTGVVDAGKIQSKFEEIGTREDLSNEGIEELLTATQENKNAPSDQGGSSEDAFEARLDGRHDKDMITDLTSMVLPEERSTENKTGISDSDEITEDEFEELLDQIHGKGKFNCAILAGGNTAGNKEPEKKADSFLNKEPQETKPHRTSPVAEVKVPSDDSDTLVATKVKSAAETTVRVDTQRLDDIMNMVGELVLVRNRLANLKSTMNDEDVANAVSNLDVVTADLQLAVMKTRMQPIKKVFGRFPRVVRDLARSLKKEIDLKMVGEDTDLDKNLVEALADPLIHLVRNSVDHGIEMPDERESMGKSRRGTILLSATQEGDHIMLSITDDGKGMDPELLRRKAVEKGMIDQEAASRLDDKECYNLIFQAGFSTKHKISDVSGRGVGMDVVKTRITQMNGSIEIYSELGKGSEIRIKLPLTLAILPTLMVILGKQPFALPLANVVEIFNLDLNRTNVVDNQLTIMVREKAIPLFYLRNWLVPGKSFTRQEKHDSHVVIVNVGNVRVGLVVDDLVGQEEVVIKPLGAMLQGLQGMAGATITGDGKIALIIDVPGLMRKYARRF